MSEQARCQLLHWWAWLPTHYLWICRNCGAVCPQDEIHYNRWSVPR